MTRAAVSYTPGADLALTEVELGEVRAHDVKVRFMASGLCHTDVSIATGDMSVAMPIIPGHEGAGIVEDVGSAVSGLRPGDHVAFTGVIACGRCRACERGLPNLCEWGLPTIMSGRHPDGDLRTFDPSGTGLHQWACLGTLAERAIVPERSVIPIPDDVPFDVAAIAGCGVLTGAGAVLNRSSVRPGSSAVVFGCGGVGLSAVQACRLIGATTIIAVDPVRAKRELALRLGATHAIDPTSRDAVEAVRELTDGRGADHAFECTGVATVVRQAWDAVGVDGTVVTMGIAPAGSTVELPADELWSTEKSLRSSLYGSGYPRKDIPLLLELYRQGRLPIEEMITARYALDDVNAAVSDLKSGRNARGVILMND
ncbi:Zn-dependent alcohol dehydrogenase [Microbacterium sp. X-17]|uniref:Zn-dependent alcohol dehydrogenase n=1 Tax=Microbacterium sp. X-17 TaxID=3144404 RepID=UPI0031F4A400